MFCRCFADVLPIVYWPNEERSGIPDSRRGPSFACESISISVF
ncbi:unnamed protein product, partial [Ectocarpus sp. 4 AP-2014]